MTEEQAAKLVLTMQAAWPGFAEDDGANRMWATIIARTEPETGALTCRQLIGHLKRKPTIADWNEARLEVQRRPEVGQARRELGYDQGPMDPNTARRVIAEHALAVADREKRRASLSEDEFIRSEGHDPVTHRVSESGLVLRKVPPVVLG